MCRTWRDPFTDNIQLQVSCKRIWQMISGNMRKWEKIVVCLYALWNCSKNYSLEVTHSSLTKMLSSNVSFIWYFICKRELILQCVILSAVLEKDSTKKVLILTGKGNKENYYKYNTLQILGEKKSSEEYFDTRLETRNLFCSVQKMLRWACYIFLVFSLCVLI